MDFSTKEIRTDKLEEFRNNFFKILEDEKVQKNKEIKLQQKSCFHKYSQIIFYSKTHSIATCERCKYSKFVKN